ncbi:MAG: helix-turn-helix transcriptional regulator [Proteobacteria bacterium]|nr:helix-turn-helix transcriptional regulator [Pseudomonadota bacterium]
MKNKNIGTSIQSAIKEQMEHDKHFSIDFEQERYINEVAQLAYQLRIESGLSQKELAEKSNTTQQVISRLESGSDTRLPSFNLLSKIAHALGKKLTIQFN